MECVGCGYCCHDSLCGLAYGYYGGRVLPCPALIQVDGRFRCGLYERSKPPLRAILGYALGIGHGCPNEDIRQLVDMGREMAKLEARSAERSKVSHHGNGFELGG